MPKVLQKQMYILESSATNLLSLSQYDKLFSCDTRGKPILLPECQKDFKGTQWKSHFKNALPALVIWDLKILFKSKRKMKQEIDGQIGAALAVKLKWSRVKKA